MIIKNRLFKQMPSKRPLKQLLSTRRLADLLLSSLILSLVQKVRIGIILTLYFFSHRHERSQANSKGQELYQPLPRVIILKVITFFSTVTQSTHHELQKYGTNTVQRQAADMRKQEKQQHEIGFDEQWDEQYA